MSITDKAVNKYLEANGIQVQGKTDNYYRLSGNKIKAWTPPAPVAKPSLNDLKPYEDEVKVEMGVKKVKDDAMKVLEGTDVGLARILEDALVILKDKHNIDLEADLPSESKKRLLDRRVARLKVK